MARTAVTMTDLPGAGTDSPDVSVSLTATDQANDHTIANIQGGDVVGVITSAGSQTASLEGVTNRYGRPSSPGAVQSNTSSASLQLWYVVDTNGLADATGALGVNVSLDGAGINVFALRSRGAR